MSLGNNIKKIRELKNLTQQYVAKHIGVSRRWYIMMENDEVLIKEDKLLIISQLFNINNNEIRNFDNKKMLNSYLDLASTNQENEILKNEKINYEKEILLYKAIIREKELRIIDLTTIINIKR